MSSRDIHSIDQPQRHQGDALNDAINNSFSNLEDDSDDDAPEKSQNIVLQFNEDESDEVLLKRDQFMPVIEDIHQSIKQNPQNKGMQVAAAELIEVPMSDNLSDDSKQEGDLKELANDQLYEKKYKKYMKVIYSHSMLRPERLSFKDIKRLKTYLFVPKYGEQLVSWGNIRFGTQDTVLSLLSKLDFLRQELEGHQLSTVSKLTQHLKYFCLALMLCIVLIFLIKVLF